MMMKRWMVFAGLFIISLSVNASQLIRLEVEQKNDVYDVYVEMDVDAPVEAVLAILTDYEQLNRLSDSIIDSKIIHSRNENVVRVETQIENCVLFFCMDIKKVEDVTEDKNGRIMASVVADSSDFRSGHATWEVKSTARGSRVIHTARLQPDISVPSWMGAAIVKSSLRQELRQSFENLECLSRADCTNKTDKMQYSNDVTEEDFI
jgi:carbon monoxide dehydrogenase subunit G